MIASSEAVLGAHSTDFRASSWLDVGRVTPTAAKALIENGYVINVERSPARIFKDEEFEAVGAKLVPEGSWAGNRSCAVFPAAAAPSTTSNSLQTPKADEWPPSAHQQVIVAPPSPSSLGPTNSSILPSPSPQYPPTPTNPP
ncbi:MAG: hypothetical protein Q9196_004175 [Gyalolechia fulgens]